MGPGVDTNPPAVACEVLEVEQTALLGQRHRLINQIYDDIAADRSRPLEGGLARNMTSAQPPQPMSVWRHRASFDA